MNHRYEHVDNVIEVAWSMRQRNPQLAMQLSHSALELAEAIPAGYNRGQRMAWRNLAWLYECLAEYDKALPFAEQALAAFKSAKEQRHAALILNLIGLIHRRLGNFPKALGYHYQALNIFGELDDIIGKADSLNMIGAVRGSVSSHYHAEIDVRRALALYRQAPSRGGEAEALKYLCNLRSAIGDYQSALNYGVESWEAYQDVGDRRGEAEAMISIGEIHCAQDDYDSALNYFEVSVLICEESGYQLQLIKAFTWLGHIHFHNGQIAEALSRLHKALEMAKQTGSRWHVFKIHGHLAEVYKAQSDFEKAFHHFEQFHQVQTDILGERASIQLKSMELRHENELAEVRHAKLREEIEARKQVEDTLRHANQQLRQEIAQHEQLAANLDAYAHTVAHDLKHPLAVIAAYVDLMEMDDKSSDETKMWLCDTRKVTFKMSQIIDELLLLAIDATEDTVPVPLDMPTLIQDAKMRLGHLVKNYNATIEIATDMPEALGYAPWVEEVWVNYISNAIKYGGEPPHVKLGATIEDDGNVRYWVQDNGNGIDSDHQYDLFMPFKRMDDTPAQQSLDDTAGHGLGLSIVRRIVTRLGGDVAVRNEGVNGKGCTFSFTLPGVPVEIEA